MDETSPRMEDIIARITPSPFRRIVAVAILLALGGLLIYLALAHPTTAWIWRIIVLGAGAMFLFLADKVRQATALSIEFSDDRLFDSSGRELCRLADIASVERGAFAFKPSNGFMIRLKSAKPRVWAPGLWWRMGRRVGIGGVTPAAQAKFMSELIATRLGEGRQN